MLAIFWLLLGAILLGLYNGLLILDARTDDNLPQNAKINKAWHMVGLVIMIYLTITSYFIWGPAYILFSWAVFWEIFAGIVHVIGLKKPFFFVGTTVWSDKQIRKYFPEKYELASGVMKTTFLIISIIVAILL
jgi:hypothetical protein